MASNLNRLEKDKNFLSKDLFKNIYILGKNHLIALVIINYSYDNKIKFNYVSKILKQILAFNIPKFNIDGQYLLKNGMQEGASIGKVLKIIEKEWINNSFKISKDRIKEIVNTNLS